MSDRTPPTPDSGERTATIRPTKGCRVECAVTWRYEHGPDWDRSPGTGGYPGDVRRCEHGQLWIFEGRFTNTYYCEMDRWRPISRWWEPLLYRKAGRALAQVPE